MQPTSLNHKTSLRCLVEKSRQQFHSTALNAWTTSTVGREANQGGAWRDARHGFGRERERIAKLGASINFTRHQSPRKQVTDRVLSPKRGRKLVEVL